MRHQQQCSHEPGSLQEQSLSVCSPTFQRHAAFIKVVIFIYKYVYSALQTSGISHCSAQLLKSHSLLRGKKKIITFYG